MYQQIQIGMKFENVFLEILQKQSHIYDPHVNGLIKIDPVGL